MNGTIINLADGAQFGYKLSCNIMSVTIRAVIKSPNQVPQAAAFIILQNKKRKKSWLLDSVSKVYINMASYTEGFPIMRILGSA